MLLLITITEIQADGTAATANLNIKHSIRSNLSGPECVYSVTFLVYSLSEDYQSNYKRICEKVHRKYR